MVYKPGRELVLLQDDIKRLHGIVERHIITMTNLLIKLNEDNKNIYLSVLEYKNVPKIKTYNLPKNINRKKT